ncbi:hypothetical protein PVE_R2G0483 [Pseudomonas veronii 1YdBTEX2]|uniref:Uncharacterized protein n=1 Tax=Pseudomonas veronii 1YdBTEX2 TaxID=1295141 RepID=A0A1D3K824_PSEVE|nr:hypothetical protein PVE_R2G0483 [Pseudomonas veronii 1YdBTEX2]
MEIAVKVTEEELAESGMSDVEFKEHLYSLLEDSTPSLPGYNINLQVVPENR